MAYLQRLNTAIFSARAHEDIAAVTAVLDAAGLPTPRLVPTRAGRLWAGSDDSVWRCLTPVGDRTLVRLEEPRHAASAGRLVGRFHRAVADLDWDFRSVRPGAHDTPAHMATLRAALDEGRTHRLFGAVEALAADIGEGWAAWSGPTVLPRRVIHGDLKISNVRFAGDEAYALIDLDTLAMGTLDVEMGDALRSWCNRATEDDDEAHFDLDLFEAALTGWAEGVGDAASDAEWAAIVPGLERICWELAARFAADALRESYFGWDAERFVAAGEHNLVRARGQASLAAAVGARREECVAAVKRARR